MKKFLFILLLAPLVMTGQTREVLFLGNSYTGVNNLPNLIYELALSGGDTLIYSDHTPGGYTLGANPNAHSIDPQSLSAIRSGSWDFVVLQEQSQIPTIPFYKNTTMYPGARRLNDSIKFHNPCTKTMFFLTWGRQNGGQQCAGSYCSPVFTGFSHMQDSLESAYMGIANELGAYVAPVGIAWKSVIEDTSVVLHSQDQSHPNLTGSYLAACSFYAAIWQKSPVGLSYTAGLDPMLALYLQEKADSVVLDNRAQWNIGTDSLKAAFSFSASFDTLNFNNQSQNFTSVKWFFGNGDSSSVTSPSYHYDSAGTFLVTLVVSNGCSTDTFSTQVTTSSPVEVVICFPDQTLPVTIYPNPTSNLLFLRHATLHSPWWIYDLKGELIRKGTIGESGIDLHSVAPGLYFFKILEPETGFQSIKFIKQ